jgi:pumilio RNA-binding family
MSQIIVLSKEKFSSNVIEKCLEHNTAEMNTKIVESIMKEKHLYFELLIDHYGNYVIQKCLHVAVEPLKSKFIDDLKEDVK